MAGQVNGAANILSGVHTWNLDAIHGGTGIAVTDSQNRLEGCYLDFNDLLIVVRSCLCWALRGGVSPCA